MRLKFARLFIIMSAMLLVFPFLFFLFLSLAQNWRYPNLLPGSFSPASWKLIFTAQSDLLKAFVNSLLIGLAVGFASTVSGFICSRGIAYHKHKMLLLYLSYGTYILSPVIYAAILYYFFIALNLTATLTGVIAGQFITIFPFAVIFFSSFWNEKLKSYGQLVSTLGGSKFQQYKMVMIPLSKQVLLVCFFQTLLISWFEYGLTSLIGVGKVSTLTLRVFEYVQEANPYYAALSSFLLTMPPVILLWINKRYLFSNDTLLN
jgi:putative spermidine/putrescine transport system permease protein